jgi:hypothetical protein
MKEVMHMAYPLTYRNTREKVDDLVGKEFAQLPQLIQQKVSMPMSWKKGAQGNLPAQNAAELRAAD